VADQVPHPVVLLQHVGDEPGNAGRPGPNGQLPEQTGADAPALPLVGDDESHFGVVGAGRAVEATDRDDVRTVERHKSLTVAVVDVGEVFDLPGGELGVNGKEAQPGDDDDLRAVSLATMRGVGRPGAPVAT
jgi:hypothetical protein